VKRKLGLSLMLVAVLGVSVSVAAAATSPSVSTEGATKIKDTSAVGNGSVNPNGAETKYWFEWGLTSAYGSTSAKGNAGNGRSVVSVHLMLSRLLPGTKYHYRLFAENRYGETSSGADRTFKTTGHALPGVITGTAVNVNQGGATLTGTVIPNNEATEWEFEYGLSAGAYTASTVGGTVPASTKPESVSQTLSGLAPGTTFHYRLIAVHAGFSSSNGLDQTFTTFPAKRPFAGVRAKTTPHRAPTKPFVFTTTGRVVPSRLFPSAPQCNGVVAIRYFLGHRLVALTFATVQANCTFSNQVAFAHTFAYHPGHKRPGSERLRLQIRFRGNGYLAPRRAANEHVNLR
jgi:hypothetical protein